MTHNKYAQAVYSPLRENSSDNQDSHPQHTLKREVEVVNAYGVHTRPAALIVKTVRHYDSDNKNPLDVQVYINAKDRVSGKSIMGLMTLQASKGSKLNFEITGNGTAKPCMDSLVALVESGFGDMEN